MLEDTHILLLLILSYIPQHLSVIYKLEKNTYTSFRIYSDKNVCENATTWNLENGGSMESSENNSEFYMTPKDVLSCEAFSFDLLPKGVLKINIHIESVSPDDLVTAIVYEDRGNEEDAVVVREDILTAHSEFYNGSQIININAGSSYEKGYIVLLGRASNQSIVKINSISYASENSPTSGIKNTWPLIISSLHNKPSNISYSTKISKKSSESHVTRPKKILLFNSSGRLTDINQFITLPPIILPPVILPTMASLPTPVITRTTTEPTSIITTTSIFVTNNTTPVKTTHASVATTSITSPVTTTSVSSSPQVDTTSTTIYSSEIITTDIASSPKITASETISFPVSTTPYITSPINTSTTILATENTTATTINEITAPDIVSTPFISSLPVTTASATITPPVTITSVTTSPREITSSVTTISSTFITNTTTSLTKTTTPISTSPERSTTSLTEVTSPQGTTDASISSTLPIVTDTTNTVTITTHLSTTDVSTEATVNFSDDKSTLITSEIIKNTEGMTVSTSEDFSSVITDFEDKTTDKGAFWQPSTTIIITVSSFVILCF